MVYFSLVPLIVNSVAGISSHVMVAVLIVFKRSCNMLIQYDLPLISRSASTLLGMRFLFLLLLRKV